MADIVLVNPRFEVSFWGREYAMPILRRGAAQPIGALPLIAALTPSDHQVTIIDENIEPLDFERCARADIVAVTGMSVQRFRMKEILVELKARGPFIAVGGPWVTVQEDYFDGLADAIFIGEAEETWPCFLREWAEGQPQRRYEQSERTDMTTVPIPRFDLLKMGRYLYGTLQFSRGCPFQCEFCDIIVTFGRRPRIKTSAQIISELEALRACGTGICFIVDDNLIGNRKVIKSVLRDVIAWQERNDYPMLFSTEASIDLADDPEMISLMRQANIGSVFVGIESPNEASLLETKKHQNLRMAGGTILEKVHRIQDAGLDVTCGMIVGFDNDDHRVFEAQRKFIQESRISHVMLGMLHAIPKTPLHARLAAVGRLDTADSPAHGTNVIPLKMTGQELRDGYISLFKQIYEPESFFDRMDALLLKTDYADKQFSPRARRPRLRRRIEAATQLAVSLLAYVLLRRVPDKALRREYRRRVARLFLTSSGRQIALKYIYNCVLHYHSHRLAGEMYANNGRVATNF